MWDGGGVGVEQHDKRVGGGGGVCGEEGEGAWAFGHVACRREKPWESSERQRGVSSILCSVWNPMKTKVPMATDRAGWAGDTSCLHH